LKLDASVQRDRVPGCGLQDGSGLDEIDLAVSTLRRPDLDLELVRQFLREVAVARVAGVENNRLALEALPL
jgi:hypothetical protein